MVVEHQDIRLEIPTKPRPEMGTILVSGATGYIGGRLEYELIARGYHVRMMVRTASPALEEKFPGQEVVVADALRPETLMPALQGVDTAYYLIHSLLLGPAQFETVDIEAAVNFRAAAERAGVRRIIYLGGLGDTTTHLSAHLRSRIQVSQELGRGTVPVTFLRAAIIIGAGSASYEIIKNLVKNTPVLLIPKWARTLCQPIAVSDVVRYLIGALEEERTAGKSYDIGGDDILSYESMLRGFTEVLGEKRIFLRTPFSGIKVYAYLASLITPVPHSITACLMESCFNEVVCHNSDIRREIPFQPMSYRESLVRALTREEQDHIHTRWSDAYPPAYELAIKLRELGHNCRYVKTYEITSKKTAAGIFRSFCSIGGREGWFNTNWMWRLRGMVDRIFMGVGASRGRKSRSTLTFNDVIDFWRVEDIARDRMLLLRAEMKLPGRAWLQFCIECEGESTKLCVTAYFDTSSAAGTLYWYFFLPFHGIIFADLLKQIEARAV